MGGRGEGRQLDERSEDCVDLCYEVDGAFLAFVLLALFNRMAKRAGMLTVESLFQRFDE